MRVARHGLRALLFGALLSGYGRAEPSRKQSRPVYAYSNRPQIAIPVTSLGYMPPGELPAYSFFSLVELHFFDPTHLVFSFNTTGLLQRDGFCSNEDSERLVQTVLLDLPSGRVQKEAKWKLYDFGDFLWNIGDGELLLRRCSLLEKVDASLTPAAFIHPAGSLTQMTFSPDHSLLLLQEQTAPDAQDSPPAQAAKPSPASPSATTPQPSQPKTRRIKLDFVRLHPLIVIATSTVPVPVRLPILDEGFLELLEAPHSRWVVNLQPYQGPLRQVAVLHSVCTPKLTALSNDVFVAGLCNSVEEIHYEGYNLQGRALWTIPVSLDRYSPQFAVSRNGAHFAIETLRVTHPVATLDPLNSQTVDGQIVDVYDTLTGVRIATFDTTPIYTAGHNFDFSPDGRRIAILHDGRIEIYDLNGVSANTQAPPR